jgi:hypothetical protein
MRNFITAIEQVAAERLATAQAQARIGKWLFDTQKGNGRSPEPPMTNGHICGHDSKLRFRIYRSTAD